MADVAGVDYAAKNYIRPADVPLLAPHPVLTTVDEFKYTTVVVTQQ